MKYSATITVYPARKLSKATSPLLVSRSLENFASYYEAKTYLEDMKREMLLKGYTTDQMAMEVKLSINSWRDLWDLFHMWRTGTFC